MNYYRNAQRNSEGYAARVAEQLWPIASERRGACRFLADFIARAGQGTTAWAVVLDADDVRLDVGPVQLLTLSADRIWFCALGGRLAEAPDWLQDVSSRKSAVYPSSVPKESRQYELQPAKIARVPRSLRAAALQYVDAAAARRKTGRSLWAKSHSPGLIRFLESYLGIHLPRPPHVEQEPVDDIDAWAVEGALSVKLRAHRSRENALRERKLVEARSTSSDGRLRCEVPGCGFDFEEVYGALGIGYAQVHHLRPLAEAAGTVTTRLKDLAVVCANCHAMIHRNGECRPLAGLIGE